MKTRRSPTASQCRYGHDLDEVNTYIRPGTTQRICRECRRANEAARRARLKAKGVGLVRGRIDTALARFTRLTQRHDDGCWLWQGCLDKFGYGKFGYAEATIGAHQAAYQLFVGPIPDGLEIDHLCRTRACVRPDHLEAVTHAENVARAVACRTKTHCTNGHEFTPTNTYVPPSGRGRYCRACNRAAAARSKARKKEDR